MTAEDLVDRLAKHRMLGAAPHGELEWLAAHGSLRHLDTGEVLTAKDARAEGLHIVLAGRIAIFVDRGAGLNKVMEWREGDVMGLLPYSRMVNPPGDTVAQEPSTVICIHRDHFPALIRDCHETTSILVRTMLDRARAFTSSALHDEKMVSLGKLSAGLAHELNNPVAAIERSAALLGARLEEAERATRALAAAQLTAEKLAAVDAIRASCLGGRVPGVRSPIEQAEREDAISDWLSAHGIDTAAAEALAETPVTLAALDQLAGVVEGPALDAVLRWTAAGCAVRALTAEIQDAAMRVSGLVGAIKGFTHMDQALVAEPVDLLQGLGHTITMLQAKARAKSVAVAVDAPPGLPRVRGFTGEMNQIWANLIENALDAVPEAGRVEVQVRHEGRRMAVRITDNGAGIPEAIRERIFDPFFTTKPMGQGTGLGLDIVRRLVRHNDGEIAVESRPGRTEFVVTLQLAEPAGAPGAS